MSAKQLVTWHDSGLLRSKLIRHRIQNEYDMITSMGAKYQRCQFRYRTRQSQDASARPCLPSQHTSLSQARLLCAPGTYEPSDVSQLEVGFLKFIHSRETSRAIKRVHPLVTLCELRRDTSWCLVKNRCANVTAQVY